MLTALLTLAVAVSLSTLMQASWQLVVLCGVLVDLGSGAMALVLGATVAARWFVQRRGLVTGLFAASTATGQLVFLPLQASIIEFAGWRTAVPLVARDPPVYGQTAMVNPKRTSTARAIRACS
jgi:MFS family permease